MRSGSAAWAPLSHHVEKSRLLWASPSDPPLPGEERLIGPDPYPDYPDTRPESPARRARINVSSASASVARTTPAVGPSMIGVSEPFRRHRAATLPPSFRVSRTITFCEPARRYLIPIKTWCICTATSQAKPAPSSPRFAGLRGLDLNPLSKAATFWVVRIEARDSEQTRALIRTTSSHATGRLTAGHGQYLGH